MATAIGVNSSLRFKRQSGKGSPAGTTLGQLLRRESATFELKKDSYSTESEISTTQQLLSNRHGARTVDGKITGILSPGTYSDMLAAVLRRDFTAIAASTGVTLNISGSGPTFTVNRAAGSWLSDGYKVGAVVRLSVGSLSAGNINKNLVIVAIPSATDLTVMPVNGVAMAAQTNVSGCTVTAVGKVTYTPVTGHTNIYYTVEVWDPDVPASEVNTDVKVSTLGLSLPGSGNGKVDIAAVGLNQTRSVSAFYTTTVPETTTGALVAASGLLIVNGAGIATVTDLSINIDGKEQPADAVVGSNIRPDIFRGKVMVTGSFTAYFDSTTLADNFLNETAASLVCVLAADASATAKFVSLVIPTFDTNSCTPTDGETGKKRTYNFVAEYNAAGGAGQATEQTTLWVQDSDA